MKFTFGLALIAFIFFSCSQALPADPKSKLAGMFKLFIVEKIDSATGIWQTEPWVTGGESYIVYDGLGHMAVEITPKDYQKFTWISEEESINTESSRKHIDSLSIDELKAAVAHFSSNYVYVANYKVDEKAGVVTHNRITGTNPDIWNSVVERQFMFSGDTLILRVVNGNRRLKWIRQK